MKNYKFLQIEESAGRLILTLNHPPLNILNIAMLEELNDALGTIDNHPKAKVLLLKAEGKCFSAGMDVSDHLPGRFDHMLHLMRTTLETMASLEIPSVSAIHGSALGGGLEIAVFTDLVYAAAGTKLGQPEIRLGVFPPLAVAYFSELIGPRKAFDLVCTGRIIFAEEAKEIGLINDVFPTDVMWQKIDEITKTIAGYSRATLGWTKRAFREAHGKGWNEGLAHVEEIYRHKLMATEDAREGLSSFLEKRLPQWKDR